MTHLPDATLDRYASLIVKIGLNLQAGQGLIINAPIQSADLVRKVCAQAYDAGARYVYVNYSDEILRLTRFQHAPRDSFEVFPAWIPKAYEQLIREGYALLAIYAEDPDLLKDQDPALIALAHKVAMTHNLPVSELIMHNATNWCVISLPVESWAAKVFPGLPSEIQMQKLWDVILKTCRLDQPDPVTLWERHIDQLYQRSQSLTRKQYAALHLTAPGTDLRVGLPRGHRWESGRLTTQNSVDFVANIPTEEVFTLPHRAQVEGTVRASLPLSYAGQLIENFSLEFIDGRVVDFKAEKGKDILQSLLETDEGARRLGEIALVPHSSPISQSGILFFNSLYDENAASHMALGKAYSFTLQGSEALSAEELLAAGVNDSMAHEDFMFGSAETSVDGIRPDGVGEPVMRQGEWVELPS